MLELCIGFAALGIVAALFTVQHQLKRIAQALENPPETIEESPESIAKRTEAREEILQAATFGGMSQEERAAKRRATRIENCQRHNDPKEVELLLREVVGTQKQAFCPACSAYADVMYHPAPKAPTLGEWH